MDLSGAIMGEADLRGAFLDGARSSRTTSPEKFLDPMKSTYLGLGTGPGRGPGPDKNIL